MTKLTVTDIADEILKVFDLDGEALGVAMEELHNRVKAQEADPEVATKMLTESFLAALRRSNEKELREFARIKFTAPDILDLYDRVRRPLNVEYVQQQTIANKKRLEEKDPARRAENNAFLRATAADPAAHRAYLLRASLLESVRKRRVETA